MALDRSRLTALQRLGAYGVALILHLGLVAALLSPPPAKVGKRPVVMLSLGGDIALSGGGAPNLGTSPQATLPPTQEQPAELTIQEIEPVPLAPSTDMAEIPSTTSQASAAAPTVPVPAEHPDPGARRVTHVPGPEGADAAPLQTAGSSQRAGSGGTCLSKALQAALISDPSVQAAVHQLPRSAVTNAEAVFLWDGGWIAEGVTVENTVEPLRAMIIEQVRAASSECRDQSQAGPTFISVTTPNGSAVLAVGSEAWRWSDLLGPGKPEVARKVRQRTFYERLTERR